MKEDEKLKELSDTKARYWHIDILRFVCSFFVVCIHCSYNGVIYYWFEPITRIAVPTFFIISGFFWQNICEQGKQWVKLVNLIKLFLVWYSFYAIIYLITYGGGYMTQNLYIQNS